MRLPCTTRHLSLCNGTINLKKRENTKDTKLISKKQEKGTRK